MTAILQSHVPPHASFLSALRVSARLFAARPVVAIGFGIAIVVSLGAVCCGVGALAAPWFLVELFAVQIGIATGVRVVRTKAWISAGAFLMGGVAVISSVAWLLMLTLGPEASDVSSPVLSVTTVLESVAIGIVALVLALSFIVPFLFTPLILIDHGGTLRRAIFESSRLVSTGGTLRYLGLSFGVHSVQVAPAVIAATITAGALDLTAVPVAILASVPLIMVLVPLGQGVVTSAYMDRRAEILPDDSTRRRPTIRWVTWGVVIASPILAMMLVSFSLARPARLGGIETDARQSGEELADFRVARGDRSRTYYVPDTTLMVQFDSRRVSIETGDGGGAGTLPLRSRAPIDRIRVVRIGDRYALEVASGGLRQVGTVDRAGIRSDDTLKARLIDRVPSWGLLSILVSIVAIGAVFPRVLHPDDDVRSRRHTFLSAAVLAIPALASLIAAVLSLLPD